MWLRLVIVSNDSRTIKTGHVVFSKRMVKTSTVTVEPKQWMGRKITILVDDCLRSIYAIYHYHSKVKFCCHGNQTVGGANLVDCHLCNMPAAFQCYLFGAFWDRLKNSYEHKTTDFVKDHSRTFLLIDCQTCPTGGIKLGKLFLSFIVDTTKWSLYTIPDLKYFYYEAYRSLNFMVT